MFARGDPPVRGRCAARASELGCEFDGWTEFYDNDKWTQAFKDTGIDPNFYALRARDIDEVLPWAHLDCGVSMEFLKREWEHAQKAEITHDCRKGCVGCGMKRYEGACR